MPFFSYVGKKRVPTEKGTPDKEIAKCECGVLFRKGSWHRHDGEQMSWEEFQANQ